MASAGEDADLTARLAREHGVSDVRAVFQALRRGGGTMAHFSHADFGGTSQWSSGMTMVGDMFNDSLKAKLNAIAGELSRHLRAPPQDRADDRATPGHGGSRSLVILHLTDLRMVCATRCFPKTSSVIDDHDIRHQRPTDFGCVSSAEHGFHAHVGKPARRRPRFESRAGE